MRLREVQRSQSHQKNSETDEDFKKTLELIAKVGFINSFSFIYSARPGTPSFNLDKLDEKKAKKRLLEFQSTAEVIKNNYRKNLFNKKVKVLFENKMKNGNKYFGRDEHFNSVIVESNEKLTGKIKYVRILKGNQNTLFGEIYSNLNQNNYAA